MNSKWKVILSLMLLIVAICSLFVTIIIRQYNENIEALIDGKSESAMLLAETILSNITQKYQKHIIAFSNPDFSESRRQMIKSFADRDRPRLLKASKSLFKALQREDSYFATIGWILPDNRVFLRVHKPEKFGDDISAIRRDIVEVNRYHKALSGFNAGKTCIQYRLIQPVFLNGSYLGAVQFGIQSSVIYDTLQKKLGTIAGMAIKNEETAPAQKPGVKSLKEKTHTIKSLDITPFTNMATEPDWQLPRQRIILENRPHILLKVAAVTDFHGKTLGSFFVALDISKELAQKDQRLLSVFIISLFLLLFSFLILYFSYGRLVEKIITLNRSLEQNNLELEERVRQRTLTLQENQQRLQKFLDYAPLGILIADSETMGLQYANPTICTMLGYSSTELLALRTIDLHRQQDTPLFAKKFKQLASGESNTAQDTLFQRKDGSLFDADIIAAPIEHEGKTAVIGFIVDRTEMKALGEQLRRAQKMEAIGMMAGGVAHDLNNILSGVISYPELMLMQLPESSPLRKPVLAVQNAGKRAATVVADLLTVARGAASTRETCDFHKLIAEYCNSQEYGQLQFSKPDVICEKNLNAVESTISCSPTHIKKIVMNLLGYAFENGKTPKIIRLSTINKQIENSRSEAHCVPTGHYIILEIKYHSAPIPPKDLEHLFEPFYTKKVMEKSGTGLEMAVVWNTVRDHDGRIFVHSDTDETLFRVYLPLASVNRKEKNLDQDTKGCLKKDRADQKLLIVDDEPQLRDIATQMLQALGYTVKAVASGEEALELLAKNNMDLIILDMLMDPGMNGLQTFQAIRKLKPRQKAIIASGFSESDDIKEALRLGAKRFIKKPYTMQTLDTTILEALNS